MTLSSSEFANEGDNQLFQAIKTRNWKDVERLLQEQPDLAKQQDEFDNTPLHSAIGFQCPDDLLLKLLQTHPEACQTHGTDDWLPLHVAAMWGVSQNVMEALILAYPYALDDSGQNSHKGRSPRHFSGRFEHNRALLERSTEEWEQIKAERNGTAKT
ncbi:ankyrin repeat domain protein [Nitzschia inconspicua]|uniref:Ankyrin repeat domain protein n=1 Tax=Nitzschia inconspicua TaxID=303405 RepID=A0A9K3L5Y2_9STRA|nr:ankyrin repeat domain protein [Nitzschia inconspicua]